jgi:hypothetical protein
MRARGYALPIVFLVLALLTVAFFTLLDTVQSAALATGLHLDRRESFYACDGVVRLVRGQVNLLFQDNIDVTVEEIADALAPIEDLAHQYGIDVPPPLPPSSEAVTTIPSGPLAGLEVMESTTTVMVTSDPIVGCGWNLGQPLGKISPLQFLAFSVGGGSLPARATSINAGDPAFTWGRTAITGRAAGSIEAVDAEAVNLSFPAPPTGNTPSYARDFSAFLEAPTSAADGTATSERSTSRAFYNADLRIIDGVWYQRDPSAPTGRGIPIYGDGVCPNNNDPSASCAAVHGVPPAYNSARHALYSLYERHRTSGITTDNNGVVSYGRRVNGGTGSANDIVARTKQPIADGVLPINIDVGLLVQALMTNTPANQELGTWMCVRGTCPRRFNGQVYVTSTRGVDPAGQVVDALCGTNGQESTVEGGANAGATNLFPCGTGARYNAVRLWRGADLHELAGIGLTISSDLPIYVEGDWNTYSPTPPTLVMAPRVTLLSDEWKDDGSGLAGGDVRFNGSVLAGVPPRTSDVSSVIRTIESDLNVDLNGALVIGLYTNVKSDTRGYRNLQWNHPASLKSPVTVMQPPGVPRIGFTMPSAPSPFFGGN